MQYSLFHTHRGRGRKASCPDGQLLQTLHEASPCRAELVKAVISRSQEGGYVVRYWKDIAGQEKRQDLKSSRSLGEAVRPKKADMFSRRWTYRSKSQKFLSLGRARGG